MQELNKVALVNAIYIYFHISNSFSLGSVHSAFKQFDVLKPHDISVKATRSADKRSERVTRLSFKAFHTRFNLVLTPDSHILHPRAKATTVDGNGRETPVEIDRNSFFSGIANGNPSFVADVTSIEGIWIIHLHTPNEFYAVEPFRFYDGLANRKHMIVYRGQDIRAGNQTHGQSFCNGFSLYNKMNFSFHQRKSIQSKHFSSSPRSLLIKNHNFHSGTPHNIGMPNWREGFLKRKSKLQVYDTTTSHRKFDNNIRVNQSKELGTLHALNYFPFNDNIKGYRKHRKPKTRDSIKAKESSKISRYPPRRKRSESKMHYRHRHCDVLAIVHYTLYQGLGTKSDANIVATMVHLYKAVDRIYRSTSFGNLEPGYGVRLVGILIHQAPSVWGYNSGPVDKDAEKVINDMARERMFLQYCIAHLHVQKKMGHQLGLSPVANATGFLDGICGSGDLGYSHNVLLTSVTDGQGKIFPMKLYTLVMAHEIGHNWGSSHDTETEGSECAPTPENGGKYIMWAYASRGLDANNNKFSPCSRRQIGRVLEKRAHRCFLTDLELQERCGNGIVEASEDCDPGFTRLQDKDPCCNMNCGFKPGAKCSPRVQPCCTEGCQIANHTKKCYPRGAMEPCYKQSFCTGNNSWECPYSLALPNKTPCGDEGWCWHGRCESYCERMGKLKQPARDLRPCQCRQSKEALCRQCCRDLAINLRGPDAKCEVMGGQLRNGSPCYKGICSDGVCVRYIAKDQIQVKPNGLFLPLKQGQGKLGVKPAALATAILVVCDALALHVQP